MSANSVPPVQPCSSGSRKAAGRAMPPLPLYKSSPGGGWEILDSFFTAEQMRWIVALYVVLPAAAKPRITALYLTYMGPAHGLHC